MKKLEDFKSELFQKELTQEAIKSVNGGFRADTGTKPTSTYAQNGQYCGQDCADQDGNDSYHTN